MHVAYNTIVRSPATPATASHTFAKSPLQPQYRQLRGILRKPGGASFSPSYRPPASVKFFIHRRRGSSVVTRHNESSSTSTTSKQAEHHRHHHHHHQRKRSQFARRRKIREVEEMVARTAPGPLSIGLYIFLWILTISVSAIYASREWKLADAWRSVLPLERYMIPVSCEPEYENTGEIVHIDCPLRKLEQFYPPPEFSWNVEPFEGVFFETRVEMYQWVLKPEFLGVKFDGVWSQDVLGRRHASLGLYDTHINPDFIPRVPGVGRQFVKSLVGGGFSLPKLHLPEFRKSKQLPLVDDKVYTPSPEKPPTQVNYRNTQVFENALYTGNPTSPQVGDLRVTFWGSASTHVSAVGEQRNGLWGEAFIGDAKAHGGATELVAEGDHRPRELIGAYKRQRSGSETARWTLRLSTWIALSTLVAFTHRLVDRYGHTRLGPFVLGALCMGFALQCGGLCPLWCSVELWRGVLLGIAAFAALLMAGCFWRWGKSLSAPWEVVPPPPDMEFTPMKVGPSTPFLGQGKPQHFYQAI